MAAANDTSETSIRLVTPKHIALARKWARGHLGYRINDNQADALIQEMEFYAAKMNGLPAYGSGTCHDLKRTDLKRTK